MIVIATLLDSKIGGGFVGFGLLAAIGLRLLFRGLRGEPRDWLGHSLAQRGWYIFGGAFLQFPLIAWIFFLRSQGWFERWFSE